MAVLDNLGFLSWLHQDGHLSCEGGYYATKPREILFIRS